MFAQQRDGLQNNHLASKGLRLRNSNGTVYSNSTVTFNT